MKPCFVKTNFYAAKIVYFLLSRVKIIKVFLNFY